MKSYQLLKKLKRTPMSGTEQLVSWLQPCASSVGSISTFRFCGLLRTWKGRALAQSTKHWGPSPHLEVKAVKKRKDIIYFALKHSHFHNLFFPWRACHLRCPSGLSEAALGLSYRARKLVGRIMALQHSGGCHWVQSRPLHALGSVLQSAKKLPKMPMTL